MVLEEQIMNHGSGQMFVSEGGGAGYFWRALLQTPGTIHLYGEIRLPDSPT